MGRPSVLFEAGTYELELIDEPLYGPGSADNVRVYSREYNFTDAPDRPSSRHGLVPRLAKNDELPLPATYHDSDVHDGCHTSFDKLSWSGFP